MGGSPSAYHGKMPCSYASSRRSGDRSPPTASNPSASLSSGSGNPSGPRGVRRTGRARRAISARAMSRSREDLTGIQETLGVEDALQPLLQGDEVVRLL